MSDKYREQMRLKAFQQWRELGFHIDIDGDRQLRILTGSYAGLLKFCQLVHTFLSDPKNHEHTARKHYGPYSNLSLMTHDQCGIDQLNIFGTVDDLLRLRNLVQESLDDAIAGDEILIQDQYHNKAKYGLLLRVMDDGFDPATLDEQWEEK